MTTLDKLRRLELELNLCVTVRQIGQDKFGLWFWERIGSAEDFAKHEKQFVEFSVVPGTSYVELRALLKAKADEFFKRFYAHVG